MWGGILPLLIEEDVRAQPPKILPLPKGGGGLRWGWGLEFRI